MSFDEKFRYMDSHVHLDQLYYNSLGNLSYFQEAGCVPVSWSFALGEIETESEIYQYLSRHRETIQNISRNYLSSYYLAGIHPRNIFRDLKPERVDKLILPFLEDPLCRGIGEIGLETASNQEIEVLLAHLELAPEVLDRGKVFGIHTPRKNKEKITTKILELLNSYKEFTSSIVVDHCMPQTVEEVLSAGYWAGVTMSPVKASLEDINAIISKHRDKCDRIMLNTDSISEFYQDLNEFVAKSEVSSDIKTMLSKDCACEFFDIPI